MTLLMRAYFILKLFAVFLYDLWVSSIEVAVAVVLSQDRIKPRIVTVPLDTKTDLQTMLVGNFISLTPGTLTMDVGEDGRTLLIHAMFGGDSSEPTREDVRGGIQKRVMEATG